MGGLSIVWTVALLAANPDGNVLGDTISALGFAVCFYYGFTGLAAGDYTVGVLMAKGVDGMYFIEDVVRGRWSPGKRNAIILATAEADAAKYRNSVLIVREQEPGSSGKVEAATTVRDLAGFPVRAKPSTGSKAVRAEPFAAQAEAGNVRLVTFANSPSPRSNPLPRVS